MKPGEIFQFGNFQVDPLARALRQREELVTLNRRAFDVLLYLVQNPGKVLTRDELLKNVWPDTFVDENSLAQSISALRRALEEKPGDNSYIVTLPGRGYQFVSPVKVIVVDNLTIVPDAATVGGDCPASVVLQRETIRTSITTQEKELPGLPAPRRTWAWVSLGILVVSAVASYAGWRYLRPHSPPGRIMLAVLPFQNLTGDPDQEYFADGLTEETITRLGQLDPEQLGVIARTSVMGYKHSNERLDQIGRELSVQYVLEGSYRRAADHLRVTAQLIRVKDQSHVWAEEYDRQPQDILGVQDEVALAVAREIQLHLTPQQRANLTLVRAVMPEAHEAYLRGRFFLNKRTEEGFRKAIELFENAIAKDSNYAEAHAGLGDAYLLLGAYGFEPPNETLPNARAAALEALAIDDRLPDAYTTLGLIDVFSWNWVESEQSFRHAIELDPNYSQAHHWYGDAYLTAVGRNEEAMSELGKAHELDPLSLVISTDIAKRLCETGHYEEGLKQFRSVLEVDSDFTPAHYYVSQAYERRGMYSEAIAELQKISSPKPTRYVTGQLGRIYAFQGRRQEALGAISQLEELSQRTYVDPRFITEIHIALGEKDLAFLWLAREYDQHSSVIPWIKSYWMYDPIRSDPRFGELMRRAGLP